ncbi:5-formyltetrahydrofolate cyclo-ligase [Adlercreutzia sp. ZJ138]|uniref:5-formyltetrahydrofolate cyclo-ligase n=1 Tax=Adlercreutzia sp. ZJ138 TaxID=2709405 RepID=UPI0013EE0383|nr:5-formyltetrahydrofolate cyclo-ligase [Adlercreutzia sp. ZJ138]
MTDSKAQARRKAIAARSSIPLEQRAQRSQKLCERLICTYESALVPGAVVAAFYPFGSELDVRMFIRQAWERGCRVCLPCMVSFHAEGAERSAGEMVFFEMDWGEIEERRAPFLKNPSRLIDEGDPRIQAYVRVNPKEMDVVVSPLVAFDGQGNRLGYGGGNYDRFFCGLRPDAKVFGVAFEEQYFENVPCEPHDIKLPTVEIV